MSKPGGVARRVRVRVAPSPLMRQAKQLENEKMKTIEAKLKNEYRKMRKYKPFMLVGRDAECSLESARVKIAFEHAEADGRVRIIQEPDAEPFDWGDCEPDPDMLDRLGVWNVSSQVWQGCPDCGRGEWVDADSICGCAGYENPQSPYENCYVIDLMRSALDQAGIEY